MTSRCGIAMTVVLVLAAPAPAVAEQPLWELGLGVGTLTVPHYRGAITSAQNIKRVVEGSDLLTGKTKVKVQDAYSMRSTPHSQPSRHWSR